MSDISFSMTADEKDVSKALQNLINENAKLRGEITKGVNEAKSAAAQEREWQKLRERSAKDATAQMQALNASAQRIKDSVATPFQNAQKETAVLREHLQAGRLTLDEYRAALARVAKELKEATRDHAAEAEAVRKAKAAEAEAAKQAAAAERDHTAAVKEATAIASRYATKEEQVAATIKRLNELRAKGALSAKDHARAMAAEQAKLTESGQAASGFSAVLGPLGDNIAATVAGFTSMSAVIGFLKSEYDALIARQNKSKDANISLAAEQEALLMNLGGADAKQVTDQIRDLSTKSGVKEENITAAVNEAMAARGDMGVEAVIQAVGTASKVRKFAPTELAGLAAATIDTQKQTGLGTDESLGFLLQMQASSRTKSLKDLAQNFTPAVGGVMNFGADRQTAGAILASLSHGMGDTSGAMTATSAIQLSKQLREFGGGKDIGKVIAELQGDEIKRKDFLSNASFEAKALPAIEGLLSGKGAVAANFAASRKALAADPRSALDAAVAARDLPSLNIASQDQSLGNFVDQQRLRDERGAISATMRTRLREIRDQQSGNMGAVSWAKGVGEDYLGLGNQTPEGTIAAIEQQIATKERGGNDWTRLLKSMPGGQVIGGAMELNNFADKNNKEEVAILRELLAETKRQLALTEQNKHAGVVGARAAAQQEGAR